jgi:hypothetical protein
MTAMPGKIDFIIPLHRGELLQGERIKKRFDFIEELNDIDGMTYTIVGTYSDPELTVEEIRAFIPSEFFDVKILKNEEYESVAKEYGLKIKEHYYPITSVTWELIVRHAEEFRKGEAFHVFHISDMYPFSEKWAKMIYDEWFCYNKPFILGEWWGGGIVGNIGPFMDGLYNWKWSEQKRSMKGGWNGIGAYDAILPYMAMYRDLPFVPSNKTAGVLTLNFWNRMKGKKIDTIPGDMQWIDDTFGKNLSIFHNFEDKWYFVEERWNPDTTFNYLLEVYRRKKATSPSRS